MRMNGAGMSTQAFNIMGKIREVDELMEPNLQDRVFEAHPELALMGLAGRPMRHKKKTHAGWREREALVAQVSGAITWTPARCWIASDARALRQTMSSTRMRLRSRRSAFTPAACRNRSPTATPKDCGWKYGIDPGQGTVDPGRLLRVSNDQTGLLGCFAVAEQQTGIGYPESLSPLIAKVEIL
jgi:uncharacterized protein DUF429